MAFDKKQFKIKQNLALLMGLVIFIVGCASFIVGLVNMPDAAQRNLAYVLNEDGNSYTVMLKGQDSIVTSGVEVSFEGELTIPSRHNGKPVTAIAPRTFVNRTDLQSITIPASIKKIGAGAFSQCGLTNVYYEGTIEQWCEITFEEYEYGGSSEYGNSNPLDVAEYLYVNNEIVTELVISDSLSEIKPYAFYGYESLESVVIPESVTTIGINAFDECGELTIYCEAESKPSGWDSDWISSWYEFQYTVVWGYVNE